MPDSAPSHDNYTRWFLDQDNIESGVGGGGGGGGVLFLIRGDGSNAQKLENRWNCLSGLSGVVTLGMGGLRHLVVLSERHS